MKISGYPKRTLEVVVVFGSGSHRCFRGAAAKARWMAKEGQEGQVRRGLGPAGHGEE